MTYQANNHLKQRYSLENAKILLVDPSIHGLDILVHIFSGFGARTPFRASDSDEAKNIVQKHHVDLVIVEAQLGPMDGYDFVRWLRHSGMEPNCHVATIIITAHTPLSKIHRARNCGVNFVLLKPLTPKLVLDRLIWIAKENRMFIECESYMGPERRFQSVGPPPDTNGRRNTDLSLEVGDAMEPNLSQGDIDALLKPKKVTS